MSVNPPNADSSLHVSLVGSTDVAMTNALDDALEKLAEISAPPPPHPELSASQQSRETEQDLTQRILPLINDLLLATCRTDAASLLVSQLCKHFDGASVRCGIGTSKLKRLVDARLGWLGPESALREEAVDRWRMLESSEHDQLRKDSLQALIESSNLRSRPDQDDQQHDANRAFCHVAEKKIELCLPGPAGQGQCVVWVEGDTVNAKSGRWLSAHADLIATVFWSRPARSWPNVLAKIGQRSKFVIAAAMLLLGLVAIWPVQYRVSCKAQVDTLKKRLIATPFEASLLETNVQPGDAVKAGDVLAVLDGRPLRLERESIEAEIQQASKEHNVALASGRIADAQQANLKRRQLSRQHELLTQRLKRLDVVSPIDGVVVSGDLERHIGSPLKLGQTLMEVAPMDYMLIEVEIPEHEIGYVQSDAETRIKIDAIGGRSLQMRLDELFPAAEVREDRNVFIGRIKVDNSELNLRPGMRGEATTYGPLRPWAWSWVRGAVERTLWWIGY